MLVSNNKIDHGTSSLHKSCAWAWIFNYVRQRRRPRPRPSPSIVLKCQRLRVRHPMFVSLSVCEVSLSGSSMPRSFVSKMLHCYHWSFFMFLVALRISRQEIKKCITLLLNHPFPSHACSFNMDGSSAWAKLIFTRSCTSDALTESGELTEQPSF